MSLRIITNESQTFYGHGKLLITGEYFVLDGAKALAVPTTYGQSLRIKELQAASSMLYWVALNHQKKAWLNLVFNTKDFSCMNSGQPEAQRLSKILSETRRLSPKFLNTNQDYAIETQLEFPNEWGLGSSSTLIHCVARWANVNGYELLKNTIGGSGYDLAAAGIDSAILYERKGNLAQTEAINWEPSFKEQLYFVYTGKKQLSSQAIEYYKNQLKDKEPAIRKLNLITDSVLKANSLKDFEALIEEHEKIISTHLHLKKVKEIMFADYWGSVKSLGAWGGDFVLMTNGRGKEELKNYLSDRKIDTCFSWDELIYKK
ncbi:MAG: GHMP kinase [Bacteroidetes bacterium]|nr:GHMP kinase [Bacteroidota bacterium]